MGCSTILAQPFNYATSLASGNLTTLGSCPECADKYISCRAIAASWFPGEVSPPAVLKVNPCALDWRPRPGLRARTVSRGASGVLEWTSMSVASGSEARGTKLWKEEG
jgi:hypothetical protein